MEPGAFNAPVWRVTWATRDPLIGGTGGGRWHPPNAFEALYTSLAADGAMAEMYHHLSRAPVFSSSHMRLHRLSVPVERTLVFGDVAALEDVGIDEAAFRRGETERSREVGAVARFLDIGGLIVPSARWPCANLVIFPDRVSDLGAFGVEDSRDVNWPAWRERVSAAT